MAKQDPNWLQKTFGSSLNEFMDRIGWLAVAFCGLAFSWHSMVGVASYYGVDAPWSYMVSVAIDGATLVLASIGLKRSKMHDESGFVDSVFMVGLIGASIVINVDHAIILHQSKIAGILYAVPVVAAITVLERHMQFEHRAALKKVHKTGPVIIIGKNGWFYHPLKSFRLKSQSAKQHINSLGPDEKDSPNTIDESDSKQARGWARDNDIDVPKRGKVPQRVMKAFQAEVERTSSNGHARVN